MVFVFWKRILREDEEYPTFEILKTHLDTVLSNLLVPFWAGFGPGDLPRCIPASADPWQ